MDKYLRFGVVGNPIDHSLSPQIHETFSKACHIDLSYQKYHVSIDGNEFEDFVRDFFKKGGAGLNITLPFKQRAYLSVDELTERARLAGAVNTIIPLSSDRLLGDNTDGIGLVRDLIDTQQQTLSEKTILILGSGGAAQGILPSLTAENPRQISLIRRHEYSTLNKPYDIIINATPLSLSDSLPPITSAILHPNSFCYDLAYHQSRETIFTRWAKKHGVNSCDGLGMLIEQAAEAFYQWHGVRPLTHFYRAASFNEEDKNS